MDQYHLINKFMPICYPINNSKKINFETLNLGYLFNNNTLIISSKIKSFDSLENTNLTNDEILNVKNIICRNNGLKKLDGIMKFQNLESLDCSHNELTEINELPNSIKSLNCSYNEIKSLSLNLNIPSLHYSIHFNCSFNQLEELEIFSVNNIEIKCTHNKLKNLKGLSNLYNLVSLDCSSNNLESFEGLSNRLDELGILISKNNNIKTLKGLPSNLPKLTILNCDADNLSAGADKSAPFGATLDFNYVPSTPNLKMLILNNIKQEEYKYIQDHHPNIQLKLLNTNILKKCRENTAYLKALDAIKKCIKNK
jgi:Leucine-rich repeat (LRR) protein